MKYNIYLVKKHYDTTDSFKYGVYVVEKSNIEFTLEHGGVSNVTQLSCKDLIKEAEIEYYMLKNTGNLIFHDTPFLLNYLHKKHYLEPNIQDVYVSPLASYFIFRNYLEKPEENDCYDEMYVDEDDEIDTSNMPF